MVNILSHCVWPHSTTNSVMEEGLILPTLWGTMPFDCGVSWMCFSHWAQTCILSLLLCGTTMWLLQHLRTSSRSIWSQQSHLLRPLAFHSTFGTIPEIDSITMQRRGNLPSTVQSSSRAIMGTQVIDVSRKPFLWEWVKSLQGTKSLEHWKLFT